MAHDIFISHVQKDKHVATAACVRFEREGLRCWIAPRDVVPGMAWGSAIVEAIESSRVMVLIFSSAANVSPHVMRELERAARLGLIIIPVRVDDVVPARSFEYHLRAMEWLDASAPPLEQHLDRLVHTVRSKVQPRERHPLP